MNRVAQKHLLRTIGNKLVVVFNLGDRRKWDLYDLAIGTFNFDARSGKGLGGFHAPNRAAHAPPVERYNLDIVLAVKRLECR